LQKIFNLYTDTTNKNLKEQEMKFKKIFLLTACAAMITPSYAMFCPGNFNEINMGDTIANVTAQCGPPTAQKASDSTADQPQEWTYYLTQASTDPTQPQAATLRTTIFFQKDKVTNMTVNGIGLSSTQICAGQTVQVGDSPETVKAACGAPALVNVAKAPPGSAADTTKTTTYTYSTNTGNVELVFVNGVLKERK
jgi:hypothetical protein